MDACDFLSPRNVLDLAVLGVASERARTAAEVISVVKRVGGARFQPTADVIAGRIAALAEAGLLTSTPDAAPARASGEVRWRPSASGRAHVQRLLMTQSASPADALAAVCACLKICFLEMLEPDARDAVIGRSDGGASARAGSRRRRRSPAVPADAPSSSAIWRATSSAGRRS